MRVVIVDDNIVFANKISQIVIDFFSQNQESVDVKVYGNGISLLDELENNRNYDIYFLDIEMPSIDGLTLAQRVKKLEEDACIIFITSYEKYAVPSYKLRAHYYILKEEYREELNVILSRIWKEQKEEGTRKEKEYYMIRNDIRAHRIRFDDIWYLTKEKKYTVFHCKKDDYKERKSIENVQQNLPVDRFIFIDRGCVVNLRYVSEVRNLAITLSTCEGDIVLPISRRLNADVKEKLAKYWEAI